ncbi:hypothetical protein dqs_3137 [Azoarcus olearius]|uniref:VTT domain-containing protein n=1 Tax=Azoarcus sp. (strain BH72) TaxID=418699 RepID=UPI00080629B2|nr:VTT domain-containing protein [Azoarcus olearius]ANQ86165.1 hypothetical protein dqs_3137 [Azoarcus olearius]
MDIDLDQLRQTLQRDAVWVVFANVLMQQLGLPLPVVPTLLVAGSLAAGGGQGAALLLAAVLASVIADWGWYLAGRGFGYRVLSGLCRLSINPGSCVSQTEARFVRWGPWSLVVAKFVPGFSTVAPPIAGALRMPPARFVLAAAAGAALWAGSALLTGWLLRAQLQGALAAISRHGATLVLALAAVFGLWLGWKLWRRHRFRQSAAIRHIDAAALLAALEGEAPPLLLDLRGPAMLAATGVAPRALAADLDGLAAAVAHWPRTAPVVTMCACPEDATAVKAAHLLVEMGYPGALPLRGGYDAWLAVQAQSAPQPAHA